MNKLLLALFLTLTPTAFASNWYVDGVNGDDSNDCKTRTTACKTIGHAISLASSGDTIGIGPSTYVENLTINFSLKLIGSGAATTIIDGARVNRVIYINAGLLVNLSNVTIRNGLVQSVDLGGGIWNNGSTLTINHCIVSGNSVNAMAANIGSGGGIFNVGTLTISNSTIVGNSSTAHYSALGAGIYNSGTLEISNSTIFGNTAAEVFGAGRTYGGGIYNNKTGTLTISSSTISGNIAQVGSGLWGAATLQNSIVANTGPNCSGTMTSNGYNLSSDATCNFNGPGDLNITNPILGALGNYGGPTETIPLLAGSPAIDAGNPNGCTDGNGNLLKTDQRGRPRPDKEDTDGCDMGAYERQSD